MVLTKIGHGSYTSLYLSKDRIGSLYTCTGLSFKVFFTNKPSRAQVETTMSTELVKRTICQDVNQSVIFIRNQMTSFVKGCRLRNSYTCTEIQQSNSLLQYRCINVLQRLLQCGHIRRTTQYLLRVQGTCTVNSAASYPHGSTVKKLMIDGYLFTLQRLSG